MRIVLWIAVAAALGGCKREVDASFKTEPVSKGALSESVAATGEVSAVVTVTVGSQISGTISRLYVDFNSPVRKGQLLAEIDPRLFEVAQARAVAGLLAARADEEKAKVVFFDAGRSEQRLKELLAKGLVASAEVETATANRAGAAAALRAAEARVAQAKADRDGAETNVSLCKIRSPIDGIVISRNVDIGQTVAASLQSPTLFVIANDLSRMQVLANVDEADVGKVKEGMTATFTVDAFPGETFKGRIREVRQAPNSIQNVVTYAAVVDAPNPERKLRQGMTASISVVTNQRTDALRIPNAALRYRPAGEGDKPAVATAGVAKAVAADNPKKAAPKQDGEAVRPGIRKVIAYRLEGTKPVKVALLVGISDGHRTEVVSGLSEGDEVVLGEASASKRGGARGPL
ncbi:MAG: efflux RND transporter periplasmic adaptor subunit [Myxococcales bacterium]